MSHRITMLDCHGIPLEGWVCVVCGEVIAGKIEGVGVAHPCCENCWRSKRKEYEASYQRWHDEGGKNDG